MKIYFKILFLLLLVHETTASCWDPKFRLTEVLANQEDQHHIFTCRVISTYPGPDGNNSLAVVEDVYRGTPSDTVYIITGGHTMARGTRIAPGTEWLIINETKDNYHYGGATICYNLSRRIDDRNIQCSSYSNEEGLKFLSIVKQYFHLVSEKFSGDIDLKYKEQIFAKTKFKNGRAEGKWQHYYFSHELEKQALSSEIEYKSGKIEGLSTQYFEHVDPLLINWQIFIKNGVIQWKSWNKNNKTTYSYQGDTLKIEETVLMGDNGDTLRFENVIYLDMELWFRHGYYYNIKDSSDFRPLCEGNYYKGARVGKWDFYNNSGKIIETKIYPYPDTTSLLTVIYDEEGRIKNEGHLKNGHRVGRWRHYYEGIIEYTFFYSDSSRLELSIMHFRGGGSRIRPYHNGKIHGLELEFNAQNEVIELTNYVDGIKNGRNIRYNDDGKIIHESTYFKGRETTLFSTSSNAPKINGFTNGYNVQYSAKDGHKMYEGEVWMGFQVGKHIDYRKNGSYVISYHETDKETLMQPCRDRKTIRKEFYNQDGELLSVEEY